MNEKIQGLIRQSRALSKLCLTLAESGVSGAEKVRVAADRIDDGTDELIHHFVASSGGTAMDALRIMGEFPRPKRPEDPF